MADRTALVSGLIKKKLPSTKIGIIINGINEIEPQNVVASVADSAGAKVFAVAVGYPGTNPESTDKYQLSTDISDAVVWRNKIECAGHILVFIKGDVARRHSLGVLDVLNKKDLTAYAINIKVQASVTGNRPVKEFWEILEELSEQFSLSDVEEFLEAISTASDETVAISKNLWRLSLLGDDELLSGNLSKAQRKDRLVANKNKIIDIAQISENGRRNLSRSLSRATSSDKAKLQTAYRFVEEYMQYGRKATLQQLDYDTVESLMSATKPKIKNPTPAPAPVPAPTDSTGDDNTPLPVPPTPPVDEQKPLKQRDVDQMVVDQLLDGDESGEEDLRELYDHLQDDYENSSDKRVQIDDLGGIFGDYSVQIDIPQDSLRNRVNEACSKDSWGGYLEVKEESLREALNSSSEIKTYNPNTLKYDSDDSSFYEYLSKFDSFLGQDNESYTDKFVDVFDRIIKERTELAEYTDFLVYNPYLLFKANPDARNALKAYIEDWTLFYKLYNQRESKMAAASSEPTSFIGKSMIAFDVLYVHTGNDEWKALMLPLHPLYLWPYYEVLELIYNGGAILSEEDKADLKKVIEDPPQMLNYLVVDQGITGHDDKILPCSGSYQDRLPIYEDDKSRFLGDDGVASITETLESWLNFAPFSANEMRIATVDAPNLVRTIRDVVAFIDKYDIKKFVFDIYYTHGQNGTTELASMDYSDTDHLVSEMIKDGRLVFSVQNKKNIIEVQDAMLSKPVHVAFYFDQSKYKKDTIQDDGKLYINPFVITYDFKYDPINHEGSISPSSSSQTGIVGHYHDLMVSVGYLKDNTSPWFNTEAEKSSERMLQSVKNKETQWLVIADLELGNYKIKDEYEIIPIGEKTYGRRTVGIWASSDSRIIESYEKDLKEYSLNPNTSHFVEMLKHFGHIAAAGNISIPRIGFDVKATKSRQKGLLGTLFAAQWYLNRMAKDKEDVLIASLDSTEARTWLTRRTEEDDDLDQKYGQERADLVGLVYDENSATLHVQPIEVKTRDEKSQALEDYSFYTDEFGQNRLAKHAPDQVAAVIRRLKEIFNLDEAEDNKLTAARREVLKYQIITECFRNIHDEKWQEKWHSVLSKAFNKEDPEGLRIVVTGILVYIHLGTFSHEDSTPHKCLHDGDDYEIELSVLNSHDIQKAIFDDEDADQGNGDSVDSSTDDSQEIVVPQVSQEESGEADSSNTTETEGNIPDETPSVETASEQHLEAISSDGSDSLQGEQLEGAKKPLSEVRLLLGEDARTGEKFYWEFGNKKLSNRHLLINGNSGSGKTYCIEALLMEAAMQGISAAVFDYTGGFTAKKLDPIFKERLGDRVKQRVVRIDKIPINPFMRHEIEIDDDVLIPENEIDIASRIKETVASVYKLGDQQQNAVYQAALSGLQEFGNDMSFRHLAEKLEEDGSNYATTALSRLQQFIDIDPFTEDENFSWSDIRDANGMIYIFQFMGYGRDIQVMLTELLLWDLWSFALKSGDESKPLIYVIDEAQNLNHGTKSPSGKFLTEGRKNGLSGWYATQFMKPQLDDVEIQNLQQADQKLYFCPPGDGVMTVAKNIDITPQGAKDWAEKLTKLSKGECVTCGSMVRDGQWDKYEPRVIKVTSLDKRTL